MAKNGVKITELLRDYMWNVCTRHHDYRDMKDFEAFILEIRGLEYKINDADKENKQLRHRLCEQSLEISKLHEEIKGLEDKLTMKEELESKNGKLQNENDHLRKKIDALEREMF